MPDILDAIDQLREGEPKPVYVFVGTETFLIERAVRLARRATVEDGVPGFNEDLFHGARSLDGASVASAAGTLPMMAAKRFVLLRHADAMSADALNNLLGYLDKPNPSTCLVITAEKINGSTKFGRASKKLRYDARALKGGAVRKFVQAEAKGRGHAIAPAAAAAIVDAVGEDLAALDDAVERLSLYVGPEGRIGTEAVDACITRVPSESIWALVDAISRQDAKTATGAANALLANREPALRILFMIARQVRTVAKMREALADGATDTEAVRIAGAPPFKARELKTAARKFTMPHLSRAFTTIAQADLLMKGSKTPAEIVLLDTVLTLCRP